MTELAGNKLTSSDTLDESKNQEQYSVCEEMRVEECDVNMLMTEVAGTVIDSSDESENRLNIAKLDTDIKKTESCVNGETVCSWSLGPTECELSDESRSQYDRCSMSVYQQRQQPVTPVVESGSIGPTVVNMHDVDKHLATNKQTNVKQDSISTSNQWLSNTFSVITSGILGKSKSKIGKEVMENVNTNTKTNLVFKPEFNFFL